MKPGIYNFPDHYKGDQLEAFIIRLQNKDKTPINIEGSVVTMQLKNVAGILIWEFSSNLTGDKGLVLMSEGRILFPSITSWDVPRAKTYYDLQIKFPNQAIKTFASGTWKINQDISR